MSRPRSDSAPFLDGHELRPLDLPAKAPFRPAGVAIGHGASALEVAIARADRRPRAEDLRSAWRERQGGRASPLIFIVVHDERAALCGPTGDNPPVYPDLPRDQAERICRTALDQPDRHAALRFLRAALPEVESPIPGLKNDGLLATHELAVGVPRRPDWSEAGVKGRRVLDRSGKELLRGMGFDIQPTPGPASLLLTADGKRTALAVFLDQGESIEVAHARFSGLSPISYALDQADREGVAWVVVSAGRLLRLYAVKPARGVATRGQAETFVQVHLDLLSEEQAGYLWLLFSPDALREGGTLEDILDRSRDYAVGLGNRLRERIYDDVVPRLAKAVAEALGLEGPTQEDLDRAYEMALFLLFRLLFLAYAEDQRLLPYDANQSYRNRSLKKKAHELTDLIGGDGEFDAGYSHWREIAALFTAVREGNREWGVPAYDGTLFAIDPEISPIGAALETIELSNQTFGPAIAKLLLDASPEGLGPVDFRSLGVREFGTVYEGLLQSELSVAEVPLSLGRDGAYVPALKGLEIQVAEGAIYLHDASGRRKSSGTYYTKTFAVEHLLEHALEPALERHLEELAEMDEVEAAERFFDFRVADIAMGSGHFLIAAVDHIEKRLRASLADRPLPGVRAELERLRGVAARQLGDPAAAEEIEDSQLLRRQIARRCIYGVDVNPVAVHLARVSLWIHTFVRGLPLSFLDHGLVEGNSLLGIATLDEAREALGLLNENAPELWDETALDLVERASAALERLGKLSDADQAEIMRARDAQREIEEREAPVAALFDILTASRIDPDLKGTIRSGSVTHWIEEPEKLLGSSIHHAAVEALGGMKPFHFPIRFPEVFRAGREGFDVIIGNPPWEEATIEEDDFWTRHHPGLQGLPQREQERIKARLRRERPDLVARFEDEREQAERLRKVLTSGAFPGMGTGDPDLYKAFSWRFWNLARTDGGWIGVVLPRSAFSVKGSEAFRKAVLDEDRIDDLCLLLNNRGWIFEDVHPQYTISLVSIHRDVPEKDRILNLRGPYRSRARYDFGIEEPPVRFVNDEVLEWTDTAALPLLPTEESAEVFAQIRKAPRLDLDDGRSWRARPYAELHATNDRKSGLIRLSEKRPAGYWPVFKGESFDLWTPDTGTYFGWADPEPAMKHLQTRRWSGKRRSNSPFSEFIENWIAGRKTLPCLQARIAFRDVTNRTNRRTVIAALLPPEIFLTNKAPFLLWPRGDEKDQAFLLAILCSIPYDWYMRRFVETSLNYHILNPSPVPRPKRSSPLWKRAVEIAGRLAAPDERFARWAEAVGIPAAVVSADEKEGLIAELDAVAALLYGISDSQLRHVFETFHEGWEFEPRLESVLGHMRRWKERS
ncbi:MAG: Eco57I restriction-modification methylase domain-containing protein [Gemmatimonadota bacterium]